MKFIEAPNARIVRALSVPSWTHPWTGTLQGTSLAFSIIRAFIGEFRSKYLLTVSLKTVKTKLSGILRYAFIFKAALDHAFSHDRGLIIDNPGNIVLEITAALSPILNKHPFTLA